MHTPRALRGCLIWCTGVLPALLLGLAFAASVSAHPRATTNTAGTISGTLVNGSHGNAPDAGQAVTLQAAIGDQTHDVASVTTDAHGAFHFSGLDTSGNATYSAYTRFQGGLFSTPAVRFDTAATQQVTLTEYDVTSSDAGVRIVNVTILLSEPKVDRGLIPVGELITVANSDTRAYVGSLDAANGRPMNLLRFSLPLGATHLTLGAGFAAVQVAQVATGFGAAATLPPGQSLFAVAFDIPYTDTTAAVAYKAEYPTDRVVALIPTSLRFTPHDFATQPDVTATGKPYHVASRQSLTAGATVSFALHDLPRAGVDPTVSLGQLVPLGLLLALLLAALAGYYLRRGNLGLVLPRRFLRPAIRVSRREGRAQIESERLLRVLLALEQRHERGALADVEFTQQRARLRSELRMVLSREADQPQQHASVSGTASIAQATTVSTGVDAPAGTASAPRGGRP